MDDYSSDDEILDMPKMVRQVSVESEENDDITVQGLIADHVSDDETPSYHETFSNTLDPYDDVIDNDVSDNDDDLESSICGK